MNNLKDLINSEYQKITIKNNVRIISTKDKNYVIKKKNKDLNKTYNYLKSRSFNYFPEIIMSRDDYDIYEYIDNTNEPSEQKMLDLINLLTLLHNKTTFYKEIDLDKYKEIYEDILNKCEYLYNFYEDIASIIEKDIYMSPSSYLFIRNISTILGSIKYCKKEIENWYQLIQDKRKVRYVNIHNNLSLDHYLKNDKGYFISWGKNKIDMPIYDLIGLYKKHYLEFDFYELFKLYENKYPLLEEERKLLFILLSLPDKIEFNGNEYDMCVKIGSFIDYLYKTDKLIEEYNK
jgi:hypothetical protein